MERAKDPRLACFVVLIVGKDRGRRQGISPLIAQDWCAADIHTDSNTANEFVAAFAGFDQDASHFFPGDQDVVWPFDLEATQAGLALQNSISDRQGGDYSDEAAQIRA